MIGCAGSGSGKTSPECTMANFERPCRTIAVIRSSSFGAVAFCTEFGHFFSDFPNLLVWKPPPNLFCISSTFCNISFSTVTYTASRNMGSTCATRTSIDLGMCMPCRPCSKASKILRKDWQADESWATKIVDCGTVISSDRPVGRCVAANIVQGTSSDRLCNGDHGDNATYDFSGIGTSDSAIAEVRPLNQASQRIYKHTILWCNA